MKTARRTSAAPIPNVSAGGRSAAGTASAVKITANTNTLSSDRLRSIA